MKTLLPVFALLAVIMTMSSIAGDMQLRKLSEAEIKSGIPCLSAEFGFARLGSYEFRNDITLLQFVALSGGILAGTGGDSVKVIRDGKVLSAKIGQALDDSSKDIPLKAGDRIVAPTQGCFGGGLTDEELVGVNKRLLKFTEK